MSYASDMEDFVSVLVFTFCLTVAHMILVKLTWNFNEINRKSFHFQVVNITI